MNDYKPEPRQWSWSALRELSNRSFYNFVRIVNAVPKDCAPIDKYIHKPLCDFFQSPGTYRKVIAMPRDWLKSTVFTKWGSIWKYLQNKESRILIAAENERLAGRFLHWIQQQILNNHFLREMYPELKQVDQTWTRTHRWSASECDLPRIGMYSEPSITAIGVGGAAQSGHYDFLCIDDLVGKKAKESVLVLESVLRWFDNTQELLVQPHKDMPNPSVISVHGTFWFPGDFLCYIRDKYPDFQFKVVPCRKRTKKPKWEQMEYVQNPSIEDGDSNWNQFPTEYYVKMLANPEKNLDYWSQHMNDPDESSGLASFDTSWLKYYHWEEKDGQRYMVCDDDKEEFRLHSFPTHGLIDPGGFSDKRLSKTGSRFAILCGGQPYGSRKKLVTWAWAGKFKDPDKIHDEIFKADKEVRPALWHQECPAQQTYILEDIRKQAKLRRVPLRIMVLPTDERKDAKAMRIDSLKQPMFDGDIYIHKSMADLIGEVRDYPNGFTVDLIDLLGQLLQNFCRRGPRPEQDGPPRASTYRHLVESNNRCGY